MENILVKLKAILNGLSDEELKEIYRSEKKMENEK